VGRARREKRRGRLEDLVGPTQLAHLAAQAAQLLTLLAAQQLLALAGVGFGLTHPFAQRLGRNAEIAGYVGDRAAGLKDEAGASVKQLPRGTSSVVAWLRRISIPQDKILVSESP